MPLCPECKTEQRARKNGECPNCGTRVEIFKGYWYRADLGSPTVALLKHFEKLVSRQLETTFRFSIKNRYEYGKELATAQRLLNNADGDFGMARDALTLMFSEKSLGAWKSRYSLTQTLADFTVSLAVARKRAKIREDQHQKEMQQYAILSVEEDIFS